MGRASQRAKRPVYFVSVHTAVCLLFPFTAAPFKEVCFVTAAVLRTSAGVLGKYLCGSVVFSNLSHFEMGIHIMRKVFIDYSHSLLLR
jgi:hypothetical protein